MSTLPRLVFLALLSLSPLLNGCKRAHHLVHHVTSSEPDYTSQIHADIDTGHLDALKYPDFTAIQPQVVNFYDTRDFDLAWVKSGKPTKAADALMEEFSNAARRGLRPVDYDADRWSQRVANLSSPDGAALFDTAMTVNAMRFVSDLHSGRTNPAHFTFGVKGYDDKKLELDTTLEDKVVHASDVSGALDALEPQAPEYKALKESLAHYTELASQDHIEALPDLPNSSKAVALTNGYPGLLALEQRLVQVGDLASSGTNVKANLNDVSDALKRFQHRHGLNETGRLSHDTVDALNTPMSTRLLQIQDSMERWRWLDDTYQNAAILVNLPEFMLRAYEGTGDSRREVFRMEVVDGKADDETHHTPVIADQMKYLVFRPFWNVPPSIAKKEIVPHMQASSGYLSAKGYETVDLQGHPASADIARIEHGTVMVRQKSGTSNSLGLVKFMFPNPFNVYLHDTNEKALFARTYRAYSHGCIRVQDPPKLAAWVLRDNPKWDEDAISDAMNTGDDNKSVSLTHPIPVVIFYGTAWSDNGEMHFFKDIYGYDADLEKTLEAGRPYPQKPDKAITQKDA